MRLWVWLLVLAVLVAPRLAFAQREYRVGKAPGWVDAVPIPAQGVADVRSERSDVQLLLIDHQVRVQGARVESYHRSGTRITSAAGVESESEIAFSFDPSHEKLTIHEIAIHRDGARIDALATASLERVHLESDLERRIYDRRLTVHAILNDVRVGDVVEYSYTREGQNPALHGKYAASVTLALEIPVKHLRFRLLWPKARALRIGHALTEARPEVREVGEERIYTWQLAETPGIAEEDMLPAWYEPYPVVWLSEFGSWNEVARWGAALYGAHGESGPQIQRRVAEWSKLGDPEARVSAALRFVQDEVRYLGLEVGPHSLEPHDAETVLLRRFGDCKDKSLLLVTLLRQLGIDADPAFVHSSRRHLVTDSEPSPYAFDHVIVRARMGDREHWLDPTASFQRGAPTRFLPPLYGRALVVRADTQALASIPAPAYREPAIVVREHFSLGADAERVALGVLTRYREDEADAARAGFASEVIVARERHYLNFYAREFPSVELRASMTTANDDDANEFRVEEAYSIREFWRDDARELHAWAIGERLEKPKVAKRSMPLAVVHPVFVRQLIEVDLPEDYQLDPVDTTLRGPALEFSAKSAHTPRKVALTFEFRTLADHVEIADVAQHLELLDRIEEALSYRLTNRAELEAPAPAPGPKWLVVAWGLGVLVFVLGMGVSLVFARRGCRVDEPELEEGSNARAPLLVDSEAAIDAHARRLRCNCRERPQLRASDDRKQVHYLGQTLLVVSLACPSCRTRRSRYFLLLDEPISYRTQETGADSREKDGQSVI